MRALQQYRAGTLRALQQYRATLFVSRPKTVLNRPPHSLYSKDLLLALGRLRVLEPTCVCSLVRVMFCSFGNPITLTTLPHFLFSQHPILISSIRHKTMDGRRDTRNDVEKREPCAHCASLAPNEPCAHCASIARLCTMLALRQYRATLFRLAAKKLYCTNPDLLQPLRRIRVPHLCLRHGVIAAAAAGLGRARPPRLRNGLGRARPPRLCNGETIHA